jgi:PBSX family phage terminase large subunit
MKLNLLAAKYPGIRMLLVRKTRESLTQSALVTLTREVVSSLAARWVSNRGEWQYRNGSRIVTAGLDNPVKIMSSDYDVIYVQEATEASEDDWEYLTTRLGRTVGIIPYSQIIADCNPSSPNHWLKRRAEAGKLKILESKHEDNPVLYDASEKRYTSLGDAYIAKLDNLTGVRYQRLRKGLWVAAEGMVYSEFDWNAHIVDHFNPPKEWPRFWIVDFGYTHPFVWQAWAKDEDGRLYRFAELYHTGLLVEDVAERIKCWMAVKGEDFPQVVVCDHDAEGRATLEKHLRIPTIAAKKSVSPGIQTVMKRLQRDETGKPGIVFMRDSAIARDAALVDSKQPTSTEEEFELYLWQDGIKDSVPVKQHDHGMDALRYLVMHVDNIGMWSAEDFERFEQLRNGTADIDALPELTYEEAVMKANARKMWGR